MTRAAALLLALGVAYLALTRWAFRVMDCETEPDALSVPWFA